MEPAFQRGDLLFLWNRNFLRDTDVGEVVVYNVKGKDIPIVHRVVRRFGTGCVLANPIHGSLRGAQSNANLPADPSPNSSPRVITTRPTT